MIALFTAEGKLACFSVRATAERQVPPVWIAARLNTGDIKWPFTISCVDRIIKGYEENTDWKESWYDPTFS